jgi:DNA-binding GntR family transcriptional regulator
MLRATVRVNEVDRRLDDLMSRLVPSAPEGVLRRVDPRQSRTEEVLEILRASIVPGHLEPGSMHSVATLADELGVSRTPVREALIRLASRGMVRFERNRGVLILEASGDDLDEIFELRRLLEVPAARAAASRVTADNIQVLRRIIEEQELAAASADQHRLWQLDREFHHGLMELAGNRRLAAYVDHLRDVVAARTMDSARSAPRESGGAVDHREILARLERRDADALAAAVLAHLDGAHALLKRHDPAPPG